ncbi:DUF3343 domain-containing protein [Sansalvadorimonas sp. 2012CJ34-2]|uniref:DUF3343 domain-containing protein n=1 Tax=Parendozoicomonas callyspongiae TaxID=2942213 RepID=A0ABT0PIH3_9GAMM|nr:DUF3343 domain-containing protein [Sansalvadorimonas sp. 2012CJ34-2]MCL6271154.1 DUF3343 domain-containing protein [Sansalvadorimonas sp. 2012CJ34-2]
MSRSFLLFPSVRYAIKAEAVCKMQGVTCQVMPVPRQISSECGMCLEVDTARAEDILNELQQAQFQVTLANI